MRARVVRTTGRLPEPEGERAFRLGYCHLWRANGNVQKCTHGVPVLYNCTRCDSITQSEAEQTAEALGGRL